MKSRSWHFCCWHLGLLWFTAFPGGAGFAQTVFPPAGVVSEVMQRANNYWISNNTVGNAGWARSAYYTGNQRSCRVLGARDYWTWANTWAGVNQWKIGPEGPFHADAHCCGQTYLDLYRLDPQPSHLAELQARMDAVVAASAVDYWWWIDAFYMAGPTLAKLGKLTGNPNYYHKLWLLYDDMKTRRGLFDAAASLWYRDAAYFPPNTTANGEKVFWSRGNGWVFAGLARVLQEMPTNAPHYQDYVTMFQTMAPALKAVQGGDGMWRSSLHDAAEDVRPFAERCHAIGIRRSASRRPPSGIPVPNQRPQGAEEFAANAGMTQDMRAQVPRVPSLLEVEFLDDPGGSEVPDFFNRS